MEIVISSKGGVGKSFVAINVISAAISMKNQKKEKVRIAEIDIDNFTSKYLTDSQYIDTHSYDLSKFRTNRQAIFKQMEDIIAQGYDIIDTGSNMANDLVDFIKTGSAFLFKHVFIPASFSNSQETEMAARMALQWRSIGYDMQDIYIIANKYTDTKDSIENMQEIIRRIPELKNNIIKIQEIKSYETVLANGISLYDIYMKVDLAKNRIELEKARKEGNMQKILEIANMNLMKQDTIELYEKNPDFLKLLEII